MIKFQNFKQRQSSEAIEARFLDAYLSRPFREHLSEVNPVKRSRKESNWETQIAIAKYEMSKIIPSPEDMQDYLKEYNEEQSKKITPMPLFSKREMQLKEVA